MIDDGARAGASGAGKSLLARRRQQASDGQFERGDAVHHPRRIEGGEVARGLIAYDR